METLQWLAAVHLKRAAPALAQTMQPDSTAPTGVLESVSATPEIMWFGEVPWELTPSTAGFIAGLAQH